MKVNYIAVWKLHGANKLAADNPTLELARVKNPALVASVTSNPEHYFIHIDRAAAIGVGLLTGLFAPQNATPEERLAAAIENVRAQRTSQTNQGAFLVLEGHTDIETPDFRARRDLEEFAVCFDAIDKAQVMATFDSTIEAILTAVSLSVSVNVDHRIEKIGSVTYLLDPDTNNPIYTFTITGGTPYVSVASPLTEDAVAEAGNRVIRVIADRTLARPARLLSASINQATDALQAFIAAWSALEIFTNASFKAVYEARWYSIMENGAPAAATPIFERFRCVMSDKYRIADKFLVIASILDADAASSDSDEFRRLKKIRDDLLHALEAPSNFPTEAAQKLLLKYMALHLDQAD